MESSNQKRLKFAIDSILCCSSKLYKELNKGDLYELQMMANSIISCIHSLTDCIEEEKKHESKN